MFVFGPAAELAIRLRENNKSKINNSSSLSLSSILSPRLSPSAAADPPTEQSLLNYEIGERIGSGRWAVVYQATHRFSGTRVALKRVLKRDDGVVQRFMLREKEAIKRVKGNKHVVDLYEVFEDAEYIYLVQEYLPGGTLRERLRRDRCMTEAEAARCAAELALGLQHCHAQNVVHRDLSLSNVMFAEDGSAKLVDFGLAAICDDVATATFLEACGSAFFTPPEVHAAKYSIPYRGPPVDAWALGVVLHNCVTGSLPFNGSTSQCRAGVGYKPPKKSSELLQDLLCKLIEPCVEKRMTMAELLAHPWILTNVASGLLYSPVQPSEESEHEACLEMMEHMGIPRAQTRTAVTTNVFNHTAATYYLLRAASCQQKTETILKCAGLDIEATPAGKGGSLETTLRHLLLRPLATST